MSEKSIPARIEDEIKDALKRRNQIDDDIRTVEGRLNHLRSSRTHVTEHAFRLRKAAWALDGKFGDEYTDDHATGQNDRDARALRQGDST